MSGEAKSFWSSFGEYFPLEMRAAAENALMAPSQITINKQENILRRRVTNLKQLKEHIAQSLKSGSSDAARSEANESTSSSSDSSATEPSAAPAATGPSAAASAASAASAAPASAAATSEQAASRSTTGSSVKSPVGLYNGGKRSKKTKEKKRKQRKTQRKKRLL